MSKTRVQISFFGLVRICTLAFVMLSAIVWLFGWNDRITADVLGGIVGTGIAVLVVSSIIEDGS